MSFFFFSLYISCHPALGRPINRKIVQRSEHEAENERITWTARHRNGKIRNNCMDSPVCTMHAQCTCDIRGAGQSADHRLKHLSFSKIDTASPLPWPHGLGNLHHGVVIFIMGEEGLSHSFILASWIRKFTSWRCYLYHGWGGVK